MNAPDPDKMRESVDAAGLIPRKDTLTGLVNKWIAEDKFERLDDSAAPMAVNALRYNYSRIYEEEYGQWKAAMGMVLPFDTAPSAAHKTYSYRYLDWAGYADFIGDDGTVMGESSLQMTEHVGFMHEIGHKFAFTVFDLERAALDGQGLPATRQRAARKTHEALHNWVWLFGDTRKQLHGLFTHPNIQVAIAPQAALAPVGDQRDRLIENKSVDEILADVETLVETVPRTTNEELRTAKAFMPYYDVSVLKRRRVGGGDGNLSIWQLIQQLYPDVMFDTLQECEEAKRLDPRTGTNTSSLTGRCWISVADLPADEQGFVFPRPFTQRAPQEQDLKITTITHSKIGGFKTTQPLGVVRLDFVAPDNDTPTP